MTILLHNIQTPFSAVYTWLPFHSLQFGALSLHPHSLENTVDIGKSCSTDIGYIFDVNYHK